MSEEGGRDLRDAGAGDVVGGGFGEEESFVADGVDELSRKCGDDVAVGLPVVQLGYQRGEREEFLKR